jgi:pimeloyl-ACP methyl ester carboxylesterase/tetratricopeptide (TPR) repeat protein
MGLFTNHHPDSSTEGDLMKYLLIAILLMSPVAVFGQHGHGPAKEMKPTTLSTGLGDVYHPVSTKNPDAQKFFNQGLAYLYGFNHDEAVRSFTQAAQLDPQLAMAYWGAALALGSNYNLQAEGPSLLRAYTNLQKAIELAPKASEHERAYIAALAKRYSADLQTDSNKLASDYRYAMKDLVRRYPDDLDAATLYAESMMNLRPWKLWSADGKPAEDTLEIVAMLESVLKRNPNHTGANHYYIHAVEASTDVRRAYESAVRLGKLAPKAGHLVHMPSHIYIRTGDYAEAAQSNADAIVADRDYMTQTGAQGVYTMMYYNHNIHFLAAANAMKGRYADSLKSARELEANVKPHLKNMPMLEMFMPYVTVTQIRFGKWDEVLKAEKPEAELKITTAYWHLARGLAFSGIGQLSNADTELKDLKTVLKTVPADAPLGNSIAVDVLKVAELTLSGKIAIARGDKASGINLLKQAVSAEDRVAYNEPPDWDLPVREVLGGMLLLNGENAEAERVFRAEIEKHPRNGRALFGLSESLRRQGQTSSAQMVQREFEHAWVNADVTLTVADLAGMKKETVSVTSSSQLEFSTISLKTGVRLHYAVQGNPKGQPVIMLHGYTDSWFSFSKLLPLLDSRYRVYILDQRGHGNSDRSPNGYSMRGFGKDVIAFMDEKGIDQATVVGHSMGSFAAQHVAALAPTRVRKLVLLGSATTSRNDVTLDLQKEVNALSDPLPAKFVNDFQVSTTFQPMSADFLSRVISESLKCDAKTWKGVIAAHIDLKNAADLSKVKTPTLILWGDKDSIFPRNEQDLLVKAIPGSVLKVYAETGHAIHWERPTEVAQDLKSFLEGS